MTKPFIQDGKKPYQIATDKLDQAHTAAVSGLKDHLLRKSQELYQKVAS